MYSRRHALATPSARSLAALPLAATAVPTLPAQPVEVAAEFPGARTQGQARLRCFGLHVFGIRLAPTTSKPKVRSALVGPSA